MLCVRSTQHANKSQLWRFRRLAWGVVHAACFRRRYDPHGRTGMHVVIRIQAHSDLRFSCCLLSFAPAVHCPISLPTQVNPPHPSDYMCRLLCRSVVPNGCMLLNLQVLHVGDPVSTPLHPVPGAQGCRDAAHAWITESFVRRSRLRQATGRSVCLFDPFVATNPHQNKRRSSYRHRM